MTTQAFNLPPVIDADGLHEIPYFPSEVESLSEWLHWIQEELATYDLQGLAETDVARPEPDHPKYHRWAALSTMVGIWLKEYLEAEIYDKLPADVAYADDVIRAVEALVEGSRGSTPTASERSSPAPVSEVIRGPSVAHADTDTTTTTTTPKSQITRNQPQNNINSREYSAAWRQLPTQTATNGSCLYCDDPGHGTADCPYLSPRTSEQPRYTSVGLNVLGYADTTATATATATAQPGVWITSSVPMTEVFVKLAEPR